MMTLNFYQYNNKSGDSRNLISYKVGMLSVQQETLDLPELP